MADDISRNVDMMRATAQVLEILSPFSPSERLNIIAGAAQFGGIKDALFASASSEVRELLKKTTPRSGQ